MAVHPSAVHKNWFAHAHACAPVHPHAATARIPQLTRTLCALRSLYIMDPSLVRYRAALWEEVGLGDSDGPLTACPSVRANALLTATLMCSKVTVHAAQSCVAHADGEAAKGPDCQLLQALVSAGIVCLEP